LVEDVLSELGSASEEESEPVLSVDDPSAPESSPVSVGSEEPSSTSPVDSEERADSVEVTSVETSEVAALATEEASVGTDADAEAIEGAADSERALDSGLLTLAEAEGTLDPGEEESVGEAAVG
jgi:hypothetical protein